MATQTLELISQALFQPRRKFLSFREAAEETSLSERTLRRLHQSGQLDARKVGGRLIISRESLDELLRNL